MPVLWKSRDREKMPAPRSPSPVLKPLSALAVPGMFLFYKYNEIKRQSSHPTVPKRTTVTERELDHLNHKIDKLLAKIDDHEHSNTKIPKEDEECVICMAAKATMQTYPCEHKVVCRKCFVKTIQTAIAQRSLPLRCVICRSQILKLRQVSSGSKKKSKPQKSLGHKLFTRTPIQLPLCTN
ncbi:uncharacterized protein LOC132565460 [Ylistrum balloti]|uniref:uncharacterized protein LOC132565460 n=1 Tax=Ylistrum balloti TaxID=509963 RepID=UPI002905AF2F|nr:uncharacterized protein LOC132565460 [Ylistrum balloti]